MPSHAHRCSRCKTIWSHGDNCAGVLAAHECPTCESVQTDIYHGRTLPDHTMGDCSALQERKVRSQDIMPFLDSLASYLGL